MGGSREAMKQGVLRRVLQGAWPKVLLLQKIQKRHQLESAKSI